jgi:hypothetical protein
MLRLRVEEWTHGHLEEDQDGFVVHRVGVGRIHHELGQAFYLISQDPETKVIILTGPAPRGPPLFLNVKRAVAE